MDYVQAVSRVDREGGNGSWRFSIHPWAETDQIDLEAWRASVDASSNTQRIRLFLNTHTANTHTRDKTTRNKVGRERERKKFCQYWTPLIMIDGKTLTFLGQNSRLAAPGPKEGEPWGSSVLSKKSGTPKTFENAKRTKSEFYYSWLSSSLIF
jgi:hypothetical protein